MVKIANLIVILFVLLTGCDNPKPPESNLVYKIENEDKSQIFYFRNGNSCLKRADYTKFIDTKGSVEIKDLFSVNGSYQDKMEKVMELSPQFQELDAVFFQICYDYGDEKITKERFNELQKVYDGLRRKLLESKIPTVYNTCRHQDFGQEGWQNFEVYTNSSSWVGGGHDQTWWCNRVANSFINTRGIGSQHQVERISSSEQHHSDLLGHVTYKYHCTVRVSWGPLYNERTDPRCGVI